MSSLANQATVGDAKNTLQEVQTTIDQARADAPIAQRAVLTSISQSLSSAQRSLSVVNDDAPVPRSLTRSVNAVNSTIDTAKTTLGCS